MGQSQAEQEIEDPLFAGLQYPRTGHARVDAARFDAFDRRAQAVKIEIVEGDAGGRSSSAASSCSGVRTRRCSSGSRDSWCAFRGGLGGQDSEGRQRIANGRVVRRLCIACSLLHGLAAQLVE